MGAVVSVLVVVALGYVLTMQGGQEEQEELTIASFEKEVSENLSGILSLYVEDYGITGNTFWVKGTVNWVGQPDYSGSGASISMGIWWYPGEKSVNVSVDLHSGLFVRVYPTGTKYDSDSLSVPTLGGSETLYPQSYNFSLFCSYSE